MNSRIYSHQQEEKAKVSRPHRKTVQMLKDLIRVNKDRITGYEKAAYQENKSQQEGNRQESNQIENGMDPDLRNILYRMAITGRSYVNDLHAEVIRLGGAPVTQDTISGQFYLLWLDCKVAPPSASSNLSLLLDACLCGEEAVQKVYRQTLDNADDWPDNILHLLERQLGDLERAHEQLKNIRNASGDNYRSL
jgi:uncharacterized protein (TIGR02284 family)